MFRIGSIVVALLAAGACREPQADDKEATPDSTDTDTVPDAGTVPDPGANGTTPDPGTGGTTDPGTGGTTPGTGTDTDTDVVDTGVPTPAGSNLVVNLLGVWEGICCEAGIPRLSELACTWTEFDRILTDETAGLQLMCPEGDPAACTCEAVGEHMHGINGWDLDASLDLPDGGPVYPDELIATCVLVGADGALVTDFTSALCPDFRLD